MLRAIARKIKPLVTARAAFGQKVSSMAVLTVQTREGLKHQLIHKAASSFILKISGSGLAFFLSIILARILGTAGLGTYAYAMTWANLLSIPATLGIDQLIVREIAVYRTKCRWKLMTGLLRWSNCLVFAASLVLTLASALLVWMMQGGINELVKAVFLAMITVPLTSMKNLRLGAMRGLNKIVLGQIPDSLVSPIMMIVVAILMGNMPIKINVFWILSSKILVVTITFVLGSVWLWRSLPNEVKQVKPEYVGKQWFTAALPFMFLGTIELINARIDLIMLGAIEDVTAVGIYAVVAGITQLTAFVHHAALGVIAPTIASLYCNGELRKIERLIQTSVLGVFLGSLLIGSVVIGCSKYLLLVFGSEFVLGAAAMNILIGGQIFNALTGPVGLVLNMSGHQNLTAIATGVSALLNVILNAILIPQWGIVGAATATTCSIITINIIKVFMMQKTLGISLYCLPKDY